MRILCAVSSVALAASAANAATPSDARDYALAECLVRQTASPALRDEGYRLAEIAIFRAGISPFSWKALDEAVDAEQSRRPMLTTHVDAPVARSDRPVPLAFCLAVIDAPRVRAEMAKVVARRPRGR